VRLSIVLGVFAAIVWVEKPAEAQNGAWCAYRDGDGGGARNCGFATFEQCLANVRGVGGNCGPSSYPSLPENRRRRLGTRGVILIEGLRLPQQPRQLGDIRCDPPRLIAGEHFDSCRLMWRARVSNKLPLCRCENLCKIIYAYTNQLLCFLRSTQPHQERQPNKLPRPAPHLHCN